jgi:hypothetical protein
MERKAEEDIAAARLERDKRSEAYKRWHAWYYQSSDQPPTSEESFNAGWTERGAGREDVGIEGAGPRTYRKKLVEIQAMEYTGQNAVQIGEWAGREFAEKCSSPPMLVIPTLEGDHLANVGDFIIRGVKGEFYPCKPDIFAMTYDSAPPRALRAEIREVVAEQLRLLQYEGGEITAKPWAEIGEVTRNHWRDKADKILSLLAKPGEARSAEPEQSPTLASPDWVDRSVHEPQSPSSIQVQGATGSPAPGHVMGVDLGQPGGDKSVEAIGRRNEDGSIEILSIRELPQAPESPAEGRAGV